MCGLGSELLEFSVGLLASFVILKSWVATGRLPSEFCLEVWQQAALSVRTPRHQELGVTKLVHVLHIPHMGFKPSPPHSTFLGTPRVLVVT